ncbi:MAG: SpoIIE family protein phosphatase [Bacteroidia bacterium]|nr:SpoIIE family protein phosphatase [Bacteroidia bacterium]
MKKELKKTWLQCQWAGANNPYYLIQAVVSQPIELKEIKPDKMPVAVHAYMNPFTNHDIQLNKGDRLYLFSDGYPDQFGGSKGKKFLYKRFKELLVQSSPGMSQQIKSMKEQGEQIEKALDEWMTGFGKHYEQIDDITVVGLKI